MQSLIRDIDTILWIVPIPSLHHLRQTIDPYAIPPSILPHLEKLPLANQRPHHYCRCLGRRHHPYSLFPLRADGEELVSTGGGDMHPDHSFLLRPANSEHPHRSPDHRRTNPGSHAAAAQQETKDWSNHNVRLGNNYSGFRYRSPRGSTGTYRPGEDGGFHL